MSDVKLIWDQFGADISLESDDLTLDKGLETAVIISLFSDERHEGERGFWAQGQTRETFGSKLWTLGREKLTEDVRLKYENFAKEALQWLIDDNVAQSIEVLTEIQKPNQLNMQIIIKQPNAKTETFKYSRLWSSQLGENS